MKRLQLFRMILALALSSVIACQPSRDTSAPEPTFRTNTGYIKDILSSPRDLSHDEAAGGHILRKHVGQTDEQLRERLEQERNITGASTYTDRSAAEHAVGAAIAQSQGRIQRWLYSSGGHPNLVLDYDSEDPVGRTMNRGEHQSRPCTHALVVLKYDLKYAGPNNYYVLTSYPECR
jgi:Bacterial CdiA-CT RNAse A domain